MFAENLAEQFHRQREAVFLVRVQAMPPHVEAALELFSKARQYAIVGEHDIVNQLAHLRAEPVLPPFEYAELWQAGRALGREAGEALAELARLGVVCATLWPESREAIERAVAELDELIARHIRAIDALLEACRARHLDERIPSLAADNAEALELLSR